MKKTIIIVIILYLATFLSGCEKQVTTKIGFDDLVINLKSQNSYNLITNNTEYGPMVLYEEQQEAKDKFKSSIIITSKQNIKLKIKDFANENIKALQSKTQSIKVNKTQVLSFNCSGKKILGIVKDFEIEKDNTTSYFSEYFFINGTNGYILSIQSDNQTDNSDFKNSLKKMYCIK